MLSSIKQHCSENICKQYSDLCTQICVPTDSSTNGYVCLCHDGYKLLEDHITCVKKTDVIDNEIPSTLTTGEKDKSE